MCVVPTSLPCQAPHWKWCDWQNHLAAVKPLHFHLDPPSLLVMLPSNTLTLQMLISSCSLKLSWGPPLLASVEQDLWTVGVAEPWSICSGACFFTFFMLVLLKKLVRCSSMISWHAHIFSMYCILKEGWTSFGVICQRYLNAIVSRSVIEWRHLCFSQSAVWGPRQRSVQCDPL